MNFVAEFILDKSEISLHSQDLKAGMAEPEKARKRGDYVIQLGGGK